MRACHPSFGCAENEFSTWLRSQTLLLKADHIAVGSVTYAGLPQEDVIVRPAIAPESYSLSEDPSKLIIPEGKTGDKGEFALAFPNEGVFRIEFASEEHGSWRMIGPLESMPLEIDLGEVELGLSVQLMAVYPTCPGGELHIVGPLNGVAVAPRVYQAQLDSEGYGQTDLPGVGINGVSAKCSGKMEGLEVTPDSFEISPNLTEFTVFFDHAR